ncbi:hypothetical protein AcW1_004969 [Taiwanofungus camphoratus]|nr:hypothetical protein AcW2_006022 [Antrodia cinnamomea]KAI0940177.1 hypothetical protein AcV5_001353 [Antrodia cinnamomea]KAI0941279.1 hypothetical protein AcV7_002894 [Antrodia cinnamomea]KAI0960463.1 hypothetical protein AcW1_004969 [Antrodia cinnamomea]
MMAVDQFQSSSGTTVVQSTSIARPPHFCSMNTMQHTPELPIEIIMIILKDTASLSCQCASAVSLVSSWARKLALPYLFCAMIYRKRPIASMRVISGNRPSLLYSSSRRAVPAQLGRYVRNLWTESIGIASSSSDIDILQACPGVENLALSSASLRAVYMAIQCQAGGRQMDQPKSMFPSSLRSITLTTHTFRYDWHFLVGVRVPSGNLLLHNITHLRILDMQISAYIPHAHLPNLKYLALPYLDLGAGITQDPIRLPEGVVEHKNLQMIVLTVDERKFLTNPWYRIIHFFPSGPGRFCYGSPRDNFDALVRQARKKDAKLHVILSPRLGQDTCTEWETAARGGESIWTLATKARCNDSYGIGLPTIYPTATIC